MNVMLLKSNFLYVCHVHTHIHTFNWSFCFNGIYNSVIRLWIINIMNSCLLFCRLLWCNHTTSCEDDCWKFIVATKALYKKSVWGLCLYWFVVIFMHWNSKKMTFYQSIFGGRCTCSILTIPIIPQLFNSLYTVVIGMFCHILADEQW
jgi:hypothetical protein